MKIEIIDPENSFTITDFPRPTERFDSEGQTARDDHVYESCVFKCCNCNEQIEFKENDFLKHIDSEETNLSEKDVKEINKVALEIKENNISFLDFYCPKCHTPVRIYYIAGVAGKGEMFYSLRHVVTAVNNE